MKGVNQNFFVIMGLIFATILGIYGQDISYYINEHFPVIGLRTAIIIVTFLSVALYITIPTVLYVFKKSGRIYLILFTLVGIPISIWSCTVLAFWMG